MAAVRRVFKNYRTPVGEHSSDVCGHNWFTEAGRSQRKCSDTQMWRSFCCNGLFGSASWTTDQFWLKLVSIDFYITLFHYFTYSDHLRTNVVYQLSIKAFSYNHWTAALRFFMFCSCFYKSVIWINPGVNCKPSVTTQWKYRQRFWTTLATILWTWPGPGF